MPSLLNFNPLLQTYKPNAGAEDIREGAREAAGYVARGIERAGERGRAREKEFTSVFDADLSKVSDMESKQFIINKYSRLRREYVKRFQSNKDWLGYGNLPPEQRIELNSDLDSLNAEIETLNMFDKTLVEANKSYTGKGSDNPVFGVDEDLMAEYSYLKKTGNTVDMAAFLERVGDSPTGQPFVRYKKMNPAQVVSSYAQAVKKELPQMKETIKRQWESQGKVLSESEMTTRYGDEKMAKDAMYNLITTSESGMGGGLEHNLQYSLSDEEKAAAVRLYGGDAGYPLTKFYINDKADISSVIAPRVDTAKSERPDTGSDGSGGGVVSVDVVNDKYTHRDRPLYFNVSIDGEETKFGSTQIYKNDKGQWMVKGFAPDTDSFKKLYAKAKEDNNGKELTPDQEDAVFMKSMQTGKKKSVERPLKDLYETGEFERAAAKAKLNFKDLDKLNFDYKEPVKKEKVVSYTVGGKDYTEDELFEQYRKNKKYKKISDDELRAQIRKQFGE